MNGFYRIDDAEDPFIKECCSNCGIDEIKQDYTYLRRAKFMAKDKYIQFGYKGVGFYAITSGKEHVRLILIVIREEFQRQGYGKILWTHLISTAIRMGKKKITLQTRKHTPAYVFWLRRGFKVVKIDGDKAEMERSI